MSEKISPRAGKDPAPGTLANIPKLITAYFAEQPDPREKSQAVRFGTSGHRGSAFQRSFNEAHILCTTQAICLYRAKTGIDGPLFLGADTHALSEPARVSALEVLAANGVTTLLDMHDRYIPTPLVSHAILTHNKDRKGSVADGIIITPSHNPPEDGGFKYNPPNGGPADVDATKWIEKTANALMADGIKDVRRVSYERAKISPTVQRYDFIASYVDGLAQIIDVDVLRANAPKIGIDPLGGAAVDVWKYVVDRYRLSATITNPDVDPTFRFMTLDWDGKIRMDCSSPYAMAKLVNLKDNFDVAFANDTDADRHGIVCRSRGLMNPNHYLAVAVDYLARTRTQWSKTSRIGKTAVTSSLIDRVAAAHGREAWEVPVGFKWFVNGLLDGSLAFGGEESAGASFLRRDGNVWTTDKDGIIPCLLAAEMTAREGRDPGELYDRVTKNVEESFYERIDAEASAAQREKIKRLKPEQIKATELAGEPIKHIFDRAPGNDAPIDGVKVVAQNGWFAARPSGTEDIYKLYAESFTGLEHLRRIQNDAAHILAPFLT